MLRITMFRIYFKAQKHGAIPCKEETNPVNWVEQSGKSHYKAVIVTPEQAFKILMALPEPERVLTLLIAATGLRISEALGAFNGRTWTMPIRGLIFGASGRQQNH